jgi:hypothetical protein
MPIYRAIVRVLAIASIATGVYLSPSGTASARTPMRIGAHFPTALDRLCFPAEIFSAEILSASLADCQLKGPGLSPLDPTALTCDPKSDLTFRIRVVETIGANEQELAKLRVKLVQPSDSIDVVTKLFNSRPTDPEGEFPPQDEFGILKVDPPTGEPLSDQEMSRLFVGQKFIFGIKPNPFDKTHLPSTAVWTMRQRDWVEDNLRNSMGTCSRLIQHNNPP